MPESLNTPEHERGIEAAAKALAGFERSHGGYETGIYAATDTLAEAAIAAYLRERTDLVEREPIVRIIERAEVRLVHGGVNIPNYEPGMMVYFPGDDWRHLLCEFGADHAA